MPRLEACCPHCFGDRGLEKIIAGVSKRHGQCPVCLSENATLVAPAQLRDVFGPLVNIYEEDPKDGRPLIDWMRDDWDLFHHSRMEDARAKELLAEVLDNGEIIRKLFIPSPKYQSDRLLKWETLRTELMHQNRYFPATQIGLERLEELLDLLAVDSEKRNWFRARLQNADTAFDLKDMGAPPPRVASHGRANPAGIPYLYLGSTPETAVAEVRPHTGEKACVAEFELKDGLKFVDLRNPRRAVSPFEFSDEDLIGRLRGDVAFLQRLGDELTRPVLPQGAPYDYVPSQYVCEYIKKCGYSGVLYRSSVSDGMNVALFDPLLGAAKAVVQYDIVRVAAEIRAVPKA